MLIIKKNKLIEYTDIYIMQNDIKYTSPLNKKLHPKQIKKDYNFGSYNKPLKSILERK